MGQPQELDALFTRIFMKADEYLAGTQEVIAATVRMEARIDAFAIRATVALGGVTATVAGMGASLAGTIQTVATDIQAASAALANLSVVNPASVFGISSAIRSLSNAFKTFQPLTAGIAGMINGIQAVNLMLTNLVTPDPVPVAGIRRAMKSLRTTFEDFQNTNLNVVRISGDITHFATAMAGLGAVNLEPLARSLSRIGNFLAGASAIQPGKLATLLPELKQFAAGLSGLSGVGSSGGRGVAGGAGAVTGALAGIPPAASKATASLGAVDNRMRSLNATSSTLASTINGVRLSILGLAGFGIYGFAQVDDVLKRAEGHMRNLGTHEPGARQAFMGKIQELSTASTSSPTELAKGLDALASSGLSAGASVKALAIAEDFAVASGMKMSEAVRKLIDVQHGLNLAGDGTRMQEYYNGLEKVSNMLVKAASLSGSTEAQLADAMTGKLTTAMKRVNMEAEEAVATVAVLSRLSQSFRGAAGGDTASRMINSITQGVLNNPTQWMMMTKGAVDEEGKFNNILDVLEGLGKTIAPMDSTQAMAQMGELGLGSQSKMVNSVEVLARNATAIKQLAAELRVADGAAKTMADTVRESLLSQLKILWNSVTTIANVFGERLAPAIQGVTQAVVSLTMGFLSLNPAIQNLVVIGGMVLLTYRPVFSILSYGFGLLISPVTMLIESMTALVSVGWSVATAFTKGIYSATIMLVSGLGRVYMAFEWVGKGIARVMLGTVDLILNIKSLAMTALVGLANILVSIASAAAGLVATFFLIAPVMAAIAAPIVTIGIGLYQLVGLAGGALVGAWKAFQGAAHAALDWVGDRIVVIRDELGSMWRVIQANGIAAVNMLAAAFANVAGFVWHLRENVAAVFDWLEMYGVEPFRDMMDAAFELTNIIGGNLSLVVVALGKTIATVLYAAWASVSNYAQTIFYGIRGQWDNILADMGTMFVTFVKNLAKNFSTLNELFTKLRDIAYAEATTYPVAFTKEQYDRRMKEIKERFEGEREIAIGAAIGKMSGPLAGMPALQTDFSGINEALGVSTATNTKIWVGAGRTAAKAFSEAFAGMKPLSGAFDLILNSVMWDDLFRKLNMDLPPNAFGALGEYILKMIKPMAESDEEMGAPAGPGGPGFTFKQTSEARFMTGGEDLGAINFQQLYELKLLNRKFDQLLQARGVIFNNDSPNWLKFKEANK